ncbi:TetR/AcrR family transcriptional regulator C-terminal domain-containing protein (plasmid) [Nocardioides sp. R1-1]|uniref:TetR/AcrR family transcriptional regulator C-terminal domain-containing protein n=1 Tax=Nocardioides sp. R1-1 TaxID=3383502 RepID=UPI0038D0AB60
MANTRVKKGRHARGISRLQVVTAALAIIDAEGVEALTMRRLADFLGVYPTTIYWHAGNRSQLLAHVSHEVLSSIDVPHPGSVQWDEWVLKLAHAARSKFRQHPNLAADFASRIHLTSTGMTMADKVLTVLEDAGFRDERLVFAYNTVLGGIFGWIAAEFAIEPSSEDRTKAEDLREAVLHAPENLPTLHRNRAALADRAFMLRTSSGRTTPMDMSFDFAMKTMVAGLQVLAAE